MLLVKLRVLIVPMKSFLVLSKKATNLGSNTTSIKSLEVNTEVWISKDAAVPNDDVHEGGEIYTSKYETSWIVAFDKQGAALIMVMKDFKLVAEGSQSSGVEVTKLTDKNNPAIVYERGSYKEDKDNVKFYAIIDKNCKIGNQEKEI